MNEQEKRELIEKVLGPYFEEGWVEPIDSFRALASQAIVVPVDVEYGSYSTFIKHRGNPNWTNSLCLAEITGWEGLAIAIILPCPRAPTQLPKEA